MAGIYVHIPFCRKACSYCDFHFSTGLADKGEMTGAIALEASLRAGYMDRDTASVYFGGGTPSLLSTSEFDQILSALSRHFRWDSGAEITLEANPEDINHENLAAWKTSGVNRLSIGLQSFIDEELKWMNRTHTAEESTASVKRAQDAGFGNISIDLIYGSRFQSLSTWEETLRKAVSLGTTHISAYHLTVEKRTALGAWRKQGREPQPDEELGSRQFLMMSDMLTEAGYLHYEISNFGLPGYEARHNSSYWKQEPYLGLGPSAHSFNGVSRQWNFANNSRYLAAIRKGEVHYEMESLSEKDRYNEYVMTGLRTSRGCNATEIRRMFGESFARHFETLAARKWPLLAGNDGTYILSREGRLQADGIASDLFLL